MGNEIKTNLTKKPTSHLGFSQTEWPAAALVQTMKGSRKDTVKSAVFTFQEDHLQPALADTSRPVQ